MLLQLVLDLESLVTQALLYPRSHHAEQGEINYIIGDVEDLVIGQLVVVDLLSKLLEGGFCLAPEEVFDELLEVDVEDVFVFLVLFKELHGAHDVLVEHLGDLPVGVGHPGEVLRDRKVWLVLLLQKWHQIILQVEDVVRRAHDHAQSVLEEFLYLNKLREVSNLVVVIVGIVGGWATFSVAVLLLDSFLFLFIDVFGHSEIEMNNYHWSSRYFPKLTLSDFGYSEGLHECNPVFDGDSNELSKVCVHDVFEAGDDSLEGTSLVVGRVRLVEVVLRLELVLNLADEEITPLDHHVLRHRLVVRVLNFAQV